MANAKDAAAFASHPPTLIFYLSDVADPKNADAIRVSIPNLPSVRQVNVDTPHGSEQVRFDSLRPSPTRVWCSKLDPRLKMRVPEYAQSRNAAKVDAALAGKRLNQCVKIEPLDKSKVSVRLSAS